MSKTTPHEKTELSSSPQELIASLDNSEYLKKIAKRYRKIEEPNKKYGNLLELQRAVSITRINRINAANRLLRTESFLQGVNIYYSCFSAILAILSLISEKRELAVWSTVVAIILAISIVYLNAQKYGNRSQELKTNYIALHVLLYDIEEAIAENDDGKNKDLSDRYCKLLQTSENHTDLDFLRQKKNYNHPMSRAETVKYYFLSASHLLLKGIAIAFPLVLCIRLGILNVFAGLL